MTDDDPLSAQVRLLEAREHLRRTRAALDDDSDAARGVERLVADVDALREDLVRGDGDEDSRRACE